MEYIIVGAITAGIVAFDEGVKYLCKQYLKNHD